MKDKVVLFFVMMMFMLCVGAYAENLIYYQDSTATETLRMIPVSDITPLPITGIANIGSATIEAGAPPTANSTTIVAVTSVAANVTSLANRRALAVINHSATETVWLTMDTDTASASVGAGVPVFPYGCFSTELDSDKTIGIISATDLNVTVYQDGY